MKYILPAFIALAFSMSASAQFSRSYVNGTANYSGFGSYTFANDIDEVELITLLPGTADSIHILTQKIGTDGMIHEAFHSDYPLALPVGASNFWILGVFDEDDYRYYALKIGNVSTFSLIWLKVNTSNQTLVSSYTDPQAYKSGYFDAKMIADEIVTYQIRSGGGLYRVAININSFNVASYELADNGISNTVTAANTSLGIRAGSLHIMSGHEVLVLNASQNYTVFYERPQINMYQPNLTTVSNATSVSSYLTNPNLLTITNGQVVEHYNISGDLQMSGNFGFSTTAQRNLVGYTDNHYHIFRKPTGSQVVKYYRADNGYQLVDSFDIRLSGVYQFTPTYLGVLVAATTYTKGLSPDIYNADNIGNAVLLELFDEMPTSSYSEYFSEMEFGNLRVNIGLRTKVFNEGTNNHALKYNGIPACYNLSEHFVGVNSAGDTLCNISSTYLDQNDELPGPYTNSSSYDEVMEAKYNRSYHVSRQMIEDHIDSIQSLSFTYEIPFGIKYWPAHGSVAKGQVANIAPFVDGNSNGTYEPDLGDYPSIYGDDCVLSITHSRSHGDINKALEFHSYVYTQSCDTSDVFENVVLRKIKVFSRGANIDSLYYGASFDGDLGNYSDDYMGTNTDLGLLYHYNGDLTDENTSGQIGFGDSLAAQGILILKGFKQTNDGQDNGIGSQSGECPNGYGFGDGIDDNEYLGLHSSAVYSGNAAPNVTSPTHPEELINTLDGLFRFGDTIYYGSNGYNVSGLDELIPTRYMYSGSNDTYYYGTNGLPTTFDWYEFDPTGDGSSPFPYGDRRAMFSFGNTGLLTNEHLEMDYAYLIQRTMEVSDSILDPVNNLFAKASSVRSAFLSNEGPCGINFDPIQEDLDITESQEAATIVCYPNPTTGNLFIQGIGSSNATVTVYDINGRQVLSQENIQEKQVISLAGLNGNLFIVYVTWNDTTHPFRVVKY